MHDAWNRVDDAWNRVDDAWNRVSDTWLRVDDAWNRVDDAAIRIMRKDAFDEESPDSAHKRLWKDFTWIETAVTDSLLREFHEKIHAQCEDIKALLGSSS